MIHRMPNGVTVINDVVVPKSEMLLLDAMAKRPEPLIASRIIGLLDTPISLASAYSLLKRLQKRNLITSDRKSFDVGGSIAVRVFWSILPDVAKALKEEK